MDISPNKDKKSEIAGRFQRFKPSPIRRLDDSDMTNMSPTCPSKDTTPTESEGKCGKEILPRSVPSHLLMVSILEQLCIMYAKDGYKGKELFKAISEHLVRLKVVPALTALDEMQSVRSQYRLFMDHVLHTAMLKIDKNTRALPSPSSPVEQTNRLSPQTSLSSTDDLLQMQTSRYKTEFTEEDKIGKGGFGSVYRAKHNLDGRLYAIKKIRFKHSQPEVWMKVLREVKALANLQHPNIVGYNAAWLEYSTDFTTEFPGAVTINTDDSFSSKESRMHHSKSTEYGDSIVFDSHVKFDNDYSLDNSHSSLPKLTVLTDSEGQLVSQSKHCEACEILRNSTNDGKFSQNGKVIQRQLSEFQATKLHIHTSNFGRAWEHEHHHHHHRDSFWNKPYGIRRSMSCDCIMCRNHSDDKQVMLGYHNYSEDNIHSKIHVTLYIQMELCSLTLREWIQNRNVRCSSFHEFSTTCTVSNMKIFKQLVKGVDFIHSNGLIHRDLKPRNIFLQGPQLLVKIGDFGLAKDDMKTSGRDDALLTPSPVESIDSFYWDTHTSGVGTSTYGAPEQLQGSVYTNKSDIYSLGVILYELFHWFRTDMEKYKCLELLRAGEIDIQTKQHWPEQVNAVLEMTNCEHTDRPTTKALLQSELFLTKDQIISEMQSKIDNQEEELRKLKDLLKERDTQIDILKASLILEQSRLPKPRLPHHHRKKDDDK